MEFRDSPQEAAFRQEVRGFIRRELPQELTGRESDWGLWAGGEAFFARGHDAVAAWRRKLGTRGWVAPAWPKEYGGAGLSVMEQFIFNEEMALARAPLVGGIGVGWAGPTIILFGTEEQKREHLEPILRGETVWCQGFSEPEAGSDLASLKTRAVRDGDDYLVTGQKTWASGAHAADWMILLARTDPDVPKHKGISFFLVDMMSPGITVRPLVNMLDSHEFNEVFFENVRVPRKNLLGDENKGWYVAGATLAFERSGVAHAVRHQLIVEQLLDYAREQRLGGKSILERHPQVRLELADRYLETQVLRMMSYMVVSSQSRGQVPNIEASIAKLYVSELDQRIAATGMRLLGLFGQLNRDPKWAPLNGRVCRMYMHATASTIGGGTSEIQRNIIAMRGLGLPRG
jgi:alkylation response protein AidB-like acyl-CoA dehydrogenase